MTEAEWNSCTDPSLMLPFLRHSGKASHRKLRLFACACCRQLDPGLSDERVRTAIEVTERWVDGAASQEEIEAASRAVHAVVYQPWMTVFEEHRALTKGEARMAWLLRIARWASETVRPGAVFTAAEAPNDSWMLERGIAEQGWPSKLTHLLHDIFGPLPFREIRTDPVWFAWRDGTVPKLAQTVYDERQVPEGLLDRARLCVLADALEEAGCTNQSILTHCRNGGAHVRGCWAVDLILGKQ